MATAKTANDDVGMVTGLFYDRDSAERAYRSIFGRGYDKDEINLTMADETRKGLFPEDGLVTELGTKAAEEGVDLGNPERRNARHADDGGQRHRRSRRVAAACRDSASSSPGPLPRRSPARRPPASPAA